MGTWGLYNWYIQRHKRRKREKLYSVDPFTGNVTSLLLVFME